MSRRRRRPNRRRQTVVAALAGAFVLAGLAYLALTASNGLPIKSYYYLSAQFRQTGELAPYSDVRIAGKLVGQVLGTSFVRRRATVKLQLDSSLGKLRSDTTARIRLLGLLGAEYVQLTPGAHGPPLASGATIPVSQTSTSVTVFDVFAMFDARRRADLRAMLGGLGEGLLGRGAQLNGALAQSPDLAANVRALATTVNDRPGAARRLVPGLASLTAAVEPVRGQLASGWQPEAAALAPLSDQRESVQATLSEAPSALGTAQRGFSETDPLLAGVASLSRELIALTGPAPAALRSATALLDAAPRPLADADTLLHTLSGAIPSTVGLLTRAWPLATPADRALSNALPQLAELGHYSCDLAMWGRDYSALFALGSPPDTSAGPIGLLRGAFADNPNTLTPQAPGVVPAKWYDPPCTAYLDKLP